MSRGNGLSRQESLKGPSVAIGELAPNGDLDPGQVHTNMGVAGAGWVIVRKAKEVVAHLTEIKQNSMNKTDWVLARLGSKFSWKRGLYTVVSISDGGLWILERVWKPPWY